MKLKYINYINVYIYIYIYIYLYIYIYIYIYIFIYIYIYIYIYLYIYIYIYIYICNFIQMLTWSWVISILISLLYASLSYDVEELPILCNGVVVSHWVLAHTII